MTSPSPLNRLSPLALAALLTCPLAHAAGAAQAVAKAPAPALQAYALERVVSVRSGNTGWDYNAIDSARGHMFIAHRKDGLQVFDVRKGRMLKTMAQSEGTNTSALALENDIGIAGTTEGEVVVFKPSTLKTLKRYKSSTGGFDGATYDPVSQRFAIVGEADHGKHSTPVLFFDGKTGEPIGQLEIASEKVDAPRPDDSGHIFLPLRDKAQVARVDTRLLSQDALWPLAPQAPVAPINCLQPASLDVDVANKRLFVACRGKGAAEPVLQVLDTASGKAVAQIRIGQGTDDVFYDKARKTVVTVNGGDATLTQITQRSADDYTLAQTVSTRPWARTGVLDEATGKIHLITAQFVHVYDAAGAPVTTFQPDSFVVLSYGRKKLVAGEVDD